MNEHIEYQGYKAKISYSQEDDVLVGRVIDVDALIMFSGSSIAELKAELKVAIDSYLAECAELGLQPEKPYKGSFNVRVGCETHRKAANKAKVWGVSLNEFVRLAIEQAVDRHVQFEGAVMVARAPIVHSMEQLYMPVSGASTRRVTPDAYGRSH
ncbi:type II toxin-antitoxin system HicB family antitoxin [Stenotrophomonas sp. Ps181]|uniref:type II toxin-antitoxin system HicB family antitoxin n=1 Tax=Stenotrophomonas sp. Ps181 TaxID=2859892 RepID=UPI0021E1122D|nr:type II toxin-antitoxin system HicB family antitoxin [Stenotrophomonas sp. Ps181]MCV0219785.1 type II toxin-antitoxin system HicB family antitoxin [Stenotrophomonas sp. Ps181]